MKKFLSLVLALVMTMSLVTIGAGATDYKDLSDKSEIQYSEAVAVLNKLGIITGYEDGSFKPTGALTRGAAAKIIVSLMIGSEAASNLTVAAAPYKDVPVTNTFAAVISYCKTAGYINGYTDGTFRPTAALTGYAFSKMLLGALGYDGAVEGFSGTGWTMNVAKLGNKAGLFNDFATGFQGNDGVTREAACLLALNTLKATEVEYIGSSVSVTGKDMNVVVGNNKYTFVDNLSKNDGNIYMVNAASGKDTLMQFAEEHFTDLKFLQAGTKSDDFGRPANTWTYKNATVGDYAQTADFVFTAGVGDSAKDSNDDALKNLGLKGYTVAGASVYTNGYGNAATLASAVALEGLTGNGTIVELYKGATANTIDTVVVRQPQLMQVSSVSSKTVSLKLVTPGVGVTAVKSDDDAFNSLSNMKADDYVMVIPCKASSSASSTVSEAYAPVVVTGSLTGIYANSTNTATKAVTVAGTKYSVAAVSKDLTILAVSDVSNSKKDVTVYVDANGYATYIKDAGSSSEFMIYKDSYKSLVDGKLVTYIQGYDFNGTLVSVNVGSGSAATAAVALTRGDIVNYTSTGIVGDAEYVVDVVPYNSVVGHPAGSLVVFTGKNANADLTNTYALSSSNTYIYDASAVVDGTNTTLTVAANNGAKHTVASDVKTLFVTYDTDGSVKSVSIKNGVANVTNSELATLNGSGNPAMMYLNKDGAVKAIVIKAESSDAVSDNVLYINKLINSDIISGTKTYTYEAYINGVLENIVSTDPSAAIGNGSYATYTEADGKYVLRKVTATTTATSVFSVTMGQSNILTANNDLLLVSAGALSGLTLNLSGATWVDLTNNGIASGKTFKDCASLIGKTVVANIIVNNKAGADNQYKVAQIVLTDSATAASMLNSVTVGSPVTGTLTVSGTTATLTGTVTVADLAATSGATITVMHGVTDESGTATYQLVATDTIIVTATNGSSTTYTVA